MPEAFKKLDQRQCPNVATTLYTVPASTQVIVKHIRAVNTTGLDATLKLWHDGVTDPFVILPAATILAGGWAEFDGDIVMEAADTISGIGGTNNAITVTIYGLEVS